MTLKKDTEVGQCSSILKPVRYMRGVLKLIPNGDVYNFRCNQFPMLLYSADHQMIDSELIDYILELVD